MSYTEKDSPRTQIRQYSESQKKIRGRSSPKTEAKWYGFLLSVALVLGVCCVLMMLYTSHSEAVAERLGMARVANSLQNILDLLALPVLLFSVVLTLYALQRLHRLYRQISYPDRHSNRQPGRARRHRR